MELSKLFSSNFLPQLPTDIHNSQNLYWILIPVKSKQDQKSFSDLNPIQKALQDPENLKLFENIEDIVTKRIKIDSPGYHITVSIEKEPETQVKVEESETKILQSPKSATMKPHYNPTPTPKSPQPAQNEVSNEMPNKRKSTMAQNYLSLTSQGFAKWVLSLPKIGGNSFETYLIKIGNVSGEMGFGIFDLEDKIRLYLEDKFIGKDYYKGKNGMTKEKKKISNKMEYAMVMKKSEKDDKMTQAVKEILNFMVKEFFLLENFLEYLRNSNAQIEGKIFLLINRDLIEKIMVEFNQDLIKFKQIGISNTYKKPELINDLVEFYLKAYDFVKIKHFMYEKVESK